MTVCERRGPGVFVVARRLLANGWSRVGATPLVVGREGKWEELCAVEMKEIELKNHDNRSYGSVFPSGVSNSCRES